MNQMVTTPLYAHSVHVQDLILRQEPFAVLPVNCIAPDPDQPRREFDEESLGELAEGFAVAGVADITVRPAVPKPGEQLRTDQPSLLIIAGERRWRAAILGGYTEIGCRIRYDLSPAQVSALQLIENIQRENLSLSDTCAGVVKLMQVIDQELIDTNRQGESTLGLASERLGKGKSWVSQRANVFKLRPDIQELMTEGLVRDVEILHGLERLAELDPEEFDGCMESYSANPDSDSVPTREWLRDTLAALEAKAKRGEEQQQGDAPAVKQEAFELTAPEDEVPAADEAMPAQRPRHDGQDRAEINQRSEQYQSNRPAAANQAATEAAARRAQAQTIKTQVDEFSREVNAEAAKLFRLAFDAGQIFNNPLYFMPAATINEFSPTLPSGPLAADYTVYFQGTLTDLGEAHTVLAEPDTALNVELELKADELRKVERVLGRKIKFTLRGAMKGKAIKAALEAARKAAKARPAKGAVATGGKPQEGAASVGAFLKACTQRKAESRVPCSELCGAYEAYCHRHGIEPISTYGKTWSDAIERAKVGKTKSNGTRYYVGLQILVEGAALAA